MLVAPKFSLVTVMVDGISAIMNSEEARELRNKYSDIKIKRLRKNKKVGHRHGPVIIINPAEYNLGKLV
jgi:hypothetical protein